MGVFSLTGWSRQIQTGFLVSRHTQDTAIARLTYLYGPFTLYGRTFQIVPVHCYLNIAVLQPRHCRNNTGLGFFPFARRYSGNRCFFLFLRVLRCFSSPGSLHTPMDSVHDDRSSSCRVPPFRHPRLNGYLLLPAAFRSLSRLSSALSAKASALCPILLDLSFRYHVAS